MEEWRAVPGFDDCYEVSDRGRVRSLKGGFPKVLRPGLSSNGYLSVALNGSSKLVQHLVAAAFLGAKPPGALVLHSDGSRTNNSASNLRYGTFSENANDRTLHGRRKLTPGDVASIRASHAGGAPKADIAARFGVSRRHVSNVVRGVQYRSVK
jgi:hypothetical protein